MFLFASLFVNTCTGIQGPSGGEKGEKGDKGDTGTNYVKDFFSFSSN